MEKQYNESMNTDPERNNDREDSSEWTTVTSNGHQGLVLIPELFLVYVNDMHAESDLSRFANNLKLMRILQERTRQGVKWTWTR